MGWFTTICNGIQCTLLVSEDSYSEHRILKKQTNNKNFYTCRLRAKWSLKTHLCVVVCVCVYVCVCMCVCVCVCVGQRTGLGFDPLLFTLCEKGLFVLNKSRLVGLQASGGSPVSAAHPHSCSRLTDICTTVWLLHGFWRSELRSSGPHSRHFTHWAIFPAIKSFGHP